MTTAKPNLVQVEGLAVENTPDPFDVDSLRLSQSFIETAGTRKLLTTVPVRKPDAQTFVRVHPDPAYRLNVLMVNLRDDREFFVIHPEFASELLGETIMKTLFTSITRQGDVFLWPVTIPPPDGKDLDWWRSEREAAEYAMRTWVRVKASMSLRANVITAAEGEMKEPEWPRQSFQELLRIAFNNDRLVDRIDHPVIRRLRGLA